MVALPHQVDQWVVFDVSLCKLLLVRESGVSVSEDCVSVSRNNLPFPDRLENIILNLLV